MKSSEAAWYIRGVARPLVRCKNAPIILLVLTVIACRGPAPDVREYVVEGQILAIRPEAGEVLIKHGDIKDFMPAMTMPYKVREPALLAGKAPGDLVTARLMVSGTDAWLTTLEKTGTSPLDTVATIPAAAFVTPLQAGDPVPGTPLTDQDRKPVALADWRPAAVLVTFIYVRCPLPQFCPMLDRRFAELQKAAMADAGVSGRLKLLSVSFDPAHDTPDALRAHAQKLGADPAIWRFATAPPEIVDRFAATFGVNVIREADGTITHNLRTVLVGPDGRVVRVYDGGDWTAAGVLDEVRRSLATR